jgi:membrane protein DedA with SNARE-associated domain
LIAGLMALESTLVPIPSEVIIPPAAYLARTQGQFSFLGIVLAGAAGSWLGASAMYWAARFLGRPIVARLGRYVGLGQAKLELAEHWCARYGLPGVFFARLLPAIRHLIGIPTGVLRMDFRRYALATLFGSLLWCAVLAWLGTVVGQHPELLAGSLNRFFALVLVVAAVVVALYYVFVRRVAARR